MWAFLCFECELLSLILLSITSESINSDKSYQILVLLSVPSLFFEAHGNWFLAQVDLVFQNLSQKVHTQHTLLKIIISNWIFHHVNTQKTVCSSFNISMWTTILFQIRVFCTSSLITDQLLAIRTLILGQFRHLKKQLEDLFPSMFPSVSLFFLSPLF